MRNRFHTDRQLVDILNGPVPESYLLSWGAHTMSFRTLGLMRILISPVGDFGIYTVNDQTKRSPR